MFALGAVLIALTVLGPVIYDDYEFEENGLACVMLLSGCITVAATWLAAKLPGRPALVVIFAVAAILRLLTLGSEPFLSTDIYRYVWDGKVQAAGINPYRYIPADAALSKLRDEDIYPNINRAEYAHTAYPPVAEFFFRAAETVRAPLLALTGSADGTVPLRIVLLLCEAAIVAVMWGLLKQFGRPVTLIVAYLWHPLTFWETGNSGHIDALMTALVMAALWLLVRSRKVAGAAVAALAVLVKPYALVMLPVFWRPWDWRAPLAAVAVAVLCYLPYAGVGAAVLGFAPTYAQEEGFDSGDAFWLVRILHAALGNIPALRELYLGLALAVLVLLTLRIVTRGDAIAPERRVRDAALLLMTGLFFLSPNYPWYYLVLVPLLPLGAGAPGWILTVAGILLHLNWPMDYSVRAILWKTAINLAFLAALFASKDGLWAALSGRDRKPG